MPGRRLAERGLARRALAGRGLAGRRRTRSSRLLPGARLVGLSLELGQERGFPGLVE
jgi:hypothetical protein